LELATLPNWFNNLSGAKDLHFADAVACSLPHPSQNCHPERSVAESKDLHFVRIANPAKFGQQYTWLTSLVPPAVASH
jgi:hypothetical protein